MKQSEAISHLTLNARPELLEVISNIADVKDIKIDIIFDVMEKVLTKIAINTFGSRYNIRARIHKGNGAIIVEKVITVVAEVENIDHEISLDEAKNINDSYELGSEIIEELPSIDFNRSMVQQSLNIINRNIKEFEKKREFESYKDKAGTLVSGVVRRNEMGNITVDLGSSAEGFIRRDQIIPYEKINVGDRIRAIILEVKEDIKGPQIILSRYHSSFVAKLFTQEVPEIFDGIVEIKSIARDPGSRTKIIVSSSDGAIDPVGVCVGFRGSRINNILQEIKGEKVDLIKYSDRFLDLVINAFKPTEILKVVVDEENENLEIVVPQTSLSAVIGRGGQNIKLISRLLKWNIDILTEEEEQEKRQKDTAAKIKLLMEALDVDEVIAHLLILEGLNTCEAIIDADMEILAKVEGFNEDVAKEIKNRAEVYTKEQQNQVNQKIKELNLEKDLLDFEDLDLKTKLFLGEKGVKSLEDVADMSSFELAEMLEGQKIAHHKIENIIMAARKQLNY
ncbi:transcription termination factor NusA [Rickettsiales bacterium LUAb2]